MADSRSHSRLVWVVGKGASVAGLTGGCGPGREGEEGMAKGELLDCQEKAEQHLVWGIFIPWGERRYEMKAPAH